MSEKSLQDIIHKRLGRRIDDFLIPPPVFETMQVQFISFDNEAGSLVIQVPVLEKYLNPYGAMQGGMVAAAIDNALGPLSMLIAPPNVTRRIEIKYSRPITINLEYIIVQANLQKRDGSRLSFSAEARDPMGVLLARAKAIHWIIAEPDVD
jgi:acyl-coenzyme A thioesterase PaaI-like protein